MTNPKRRALAVEDFPDLDKLVLNEIEAMVERTYSDVCTRKKDVPNRRVSDSGWPRQRSTPPERAHRRKAENWEGDDFALGTEQGLLSEDEEKFIEDVVTWLRDRPNADCLIASIWSRVVDSDADAFHAAPGTANADAQGREAEKPKTHADAVNPDPVP
jgi:hypothetical protein